MQLIRRRRRANEQGFSLVEVLVVLMLTGIVGGIVTTTVVRALGTAAIAEARVDALADLQRGIERIGRELRSADPLLFEVDPDDEDPILFSEEVRALVHTGGETLLFRYYLVDVGDGVAELREDVTRYSGETVTSTQDGLFIANVANLATDTPLFTYYRTDTATGALEKIEDCDDPTIAECRDQHLTATQVQIRLERLLPNQEPIHLETVVSIRNTRFQSPTATP